MTWFPDGQRLAFAVSVGLGPLELYQVEAFPNAKPEPMKIELLNAGAIVWSRDGQRTLVIGSTKAKAPYELFLGDAMGRNLRRLTKDENDQSAGNWLPDGRRILYLTDFVPAPMDIAVMDVETKKETRLTDDGRILSFFWNDPTVFSVDAKDKLLTSWGKIKSQSGGKFTIPVVPG